MSKLMALMFALAIVACTPESSTEPPSPSRIETILMKDNTFNRERSLRIWLPAGYDEATQNYPVLYLFDGQNLFDASLSMFSGVEWSADETAERLIKDGAIEPLIIVGIDNAGDPGRAEEYLPWPDPNVQLPPTGPRGHDLSAFLVQDVFPLIETRYRTRNRDRGLGGSSFGGIATLTASQMAPELFNRLLVESPSLWVSGQQMLTEVENTSAEAWPMRIFIGMGGREYSRSCEADAQEYDLAGVENVERLAKTLKDDGLGPERLRVVIEECAAHSETAWARRLPEALTFLYGAT